MRDAITALAAADRSYRRFGAARHRYELLPPATTTIDVPDDYREYVTMLSAGGAGPYYGLVRIDRNAPIELPAVRSRSVPGITLAPGEPPPRALPIAHLGCGYAAVLMLDGPNRGQVWLDARALDIIEPTYPSFTAFMLDWIDRLATNQWLAGFVPPGECAITAALTGYLGVVEQQLGIEPGTLDGAALRDALAQLGPGAIDVRADRPLALFNEGDRLDPCATCARSLQGLAEQGLPSDVVATGLPPLPDRSVTATS
jgi:hypothetical protein